MVLGRARVLLIVVLALHLANSCALLPLYANQIGFRGYGEYLYPYLVPQFVYSSVPSDTPNVLRRGIVLSYIVAVEGIVLLKNNGVLPLKPDTRVAVFGRSQHWTWLYHAGGSAFVTIPPEREVTLLEGLANAGLVIDQSVVDKYSSTSSASIFPFTEEEVREIAERNDVAIIVISRFMSEDIDIPREASEPKGYYREGMWWGRKTVPLLGYTLSDEEKRMIEVVTKYFSKTIVILNTGNAIDLSWDSERISAILWVGYPGEQGGNAIAAIILGLATPSGKLPFTWAESYEDYPSAYYFGTYPDVVYYEDIYIGYRYFDTFGVDPKYPFGYGLSYTEFAIDVLGVEVDGEEVKVRVRVTNIGAYPGKEVVQVYISCPDGKLEKPYQQLVAFAKTDFLNPGESQILEIVYSLRSVASYDEESSSWILEKGDYIVRVGNSSRSTRVAAVLTLPRTVVVEDTVNRLRSPPIETLSKRKTKAKPYTYPGEEIEIASAPRIPINPDVFRSINTSLAPDLAPPEFLPIDTSGAVITLPDVYRDRYSLKQFVAQMSIEELADMVIGLRGSQRYLVPPLRHADGPNGLRQGPSENPGGTAFPSANILAATWSLELAREVGRQIGEEMVWASIDLWLAPGLNLLRNPLQGRSGEYFSEDPILAGVMGAALVKGLQSVNGVGAVVKHLVANEQETNRYTSNSLVSERALREVYLKPFEIVVKTAKPWGVMTSFNMVNGIYTGNDFDLCTAILRGEWGFDGIVMTDWWSASYNYKAVSAGNDALMPWDSRLGPKTVREIVEALNNGSITLGQIQRNVYNIVRIAMRSRSFAKLLGVEQEELYMYTPPPDYIKVFREGPPITKIAKDYRTIVYTTYTKIVTTTTTVTITREIGVIPVWAYIVMALLSTALVAVIIVLIARTRRS